jgi:hypothetical protein
MLKPPRGDDQPPDRRAKDESMELPFDNLVTRLRQILGVRLVAYIGGVMSTRPVSSWADGASEPGAVDQERLRHAYHAAALLRERYGAATVQTWFKGMNPSLGDHAPAQVLRDGEPHAVAHNVIAAALSFAYVE